MIWISQGPTALVPGLVVDSALKTLALNGCIAETLSKVVLASIATSVSTVTDNWNDNFSILFVICEYALKPIAQIVEVFLLTDFRLEDAWLYRSRGLGAYKEA